MAGGISFTKLDLSHAYLQLQLDDKTKDYLVVNTHKGLVKYTHIPFGITSAPAIFQRTVDNLLQGMKHVVVYINDILITGETEEEHLNTLNEVLTRLESAGVRLKQSKCAFMVPEVVYLGHKISKEGLKPTDDKVQAITNMPQPSNVSKFQSLPWDGIFLWDVRTSQWFWHHFTGYILRKGIQWKWPSPENEAFEAAKALLKSPKPLVHYNVDKEIVLTCDASQYGLWLQYSPTGWECLIQYASRTLTYHG